MSNQHQRELQHCEFHSASDLKKTALNQKELSHRKANGDTRPTNTCPLNPWIFASFSFRCQILLARICDLRMYRKRNLMISSCTVLGSIHWKYDKNYVQLLYNQKQKCWCGAERPWVGNNILILSPC